MSQQQIASSGAPADGSGTLRLLRRIARGLRGRARGFVRRQREFAKDCLFVLLPVKLRFQLGLLFRHLTRRSDLDAHMEFFCGRRMGDLRGWIETNWVSRRCPSELFLYYIFTGDQKRALVQFVKVDWSMLDDQSAEIVDKLAVPIIGGYTADLLAQLHIVGWSQMPARIRASFAELVTLMLEHRNFGYEERMFVGRAERDPALAGAPIEDYVPLFFQDKQLVQTIGSELALKGVDTAVQALDAQGRYWESFPAGHPLLGTLNDINLFYAYRHLLLRTYHNGEGYLVGPIYKRCMETQSRLKTQLPAPSPGLQRKLDEIEVKLEDVKLLSPDWSALIGHNGHLNVHLMMRTMGWWSGSPVLLAYPNRIANLPFLSLFEDICPTLTLGKNTTPEVWNELASLTPFLGVSHQAFEFPDGRAMYWNDAGGMAVEAWEGAGRGFPLRDIYDRRLAVDSAPVDEFERLRKQWGLAPDDWYVCLHMRDAATRGETLGRGESIRSTTWDNYVDAVRFIIAQGGKVIRMGSPKADPLPEMDGLIDYARSPYQSPAMDIHLVRMARLFIGTTSGFAYVASSFGVPTAMVNAISSVGLLWSTDTRFCLKPVYDATGRMLSQHEATSEKWRWAYPTHESVKRAGLTVTDNSADEILETVREVYDLTAMRKQEDPGLIDRWRSSVALQGFYGAAIPSLYFLRKYEASLLPQG